MKVTDTHDTAAGHFDYLDAGSLGTVVPDEGHDDTRDLVDLVSTTVPAPEAGEHLTARSA